ncbi:MAG: HEAT repeat domain-containing protein [Planctomycetaceae bacterium]
MNNTTLITALGVLHWCIAMGDAAAIAQEAGAKADAAPGLLANEPQTVEEQFEAALVMLRVARPDFAQRYLVKMLEMQPDDETLLRLRAKHGTAMFLRLSQDEKLLPQSRQLLDRVEEAAANQLRNPAYFDSLIARLQGAPRESDAALSDLKHFGADAVPEILARLGAGAGFADHDRLLTALVKFGPLAIDPLLGAIEAPEPRTRAVAIEALGWMGDESIVPRLWYPALGADQPAFVQQAALRAIARIRYGQPHLTDRLDPVGAAEEVFRAALQHFRGESTWAAGTGDPLDVWTWDASQNRLIRTATNPTAAAMMMAERLARQAMLMAPERDDFRALFLAAALGRSRYRAGWDQPLPVGPGTAHDLALMSGSDLVEFALGLAVEHGNTAAAESAAAVLASIGTRDQLSQRGARPAAIISALDFPNDRVQFAAATAVLQMHPTASFPHSSRVVEILARPLRAEGGGGPRSVIIDPNTSRAGDTASVLDSLGYNTTIARTGQEGFREAAAFGDVALAVLHPNTIRWELKQTIANLRADSRTAGIPIVVAAGEPVRAEMLRVLERVPASMFVSTDGGASDWQTQLRTVLAEIAAPPLTPQQQSERMQAAAYWLRRIAEGSQASVFDLAPAEAGLSEGVALPGIGQDAIIALGAIGRQSVQQRFVDLILAPAIDAGLRAAAAAELAAHIRRHGRLLREDAIIALTGAWNSTAEPEVRSAVAAVLGTLQLTPQAVFNNLRDYPLPEAPQP